MERPALPDGSTSAVVAIIGATGGIGSHLARRLVADGRQVWLAARSEAPLAALSAELQMPHAVLDATQPDLVVEWLQRVYTQAGPLLGLVNCAGSLLLKPAHLTSSDEWQATLAANLTTAFAAVKAAGRVMAGSGGSVVLISSAAAQIGLAHHEAIAAAKAGVVGLAKAAAASYAAKNLRFNAVAPGLIQTPLTERIWSHAAAAQASLAYHALPRLGLPADITSVIAWLLDPCQAWVTGQVFTVDGGLSGVKPPPQRAR